MNRCGKAYDEMTLEELRQEAWETLMDTDVIDGTLTLELDKLREALNRKRPVEYLYTPEESWERFLEKCAEEEEFARSSITAARAKDTAKSRRYRIGLRIALIAAVVVVLLAGAALAADSLGYDLWAWVPRMSRGKPEFESVEETIPKATILEALEKLQIHEPVYPGKFPEGFVLTESQFCDDPFILFEQYGDGKRYLSITIIPASSFETAVYQEKTETIREYRSGNVVHYLFNNVGSITAVWYTENYFVSISGNINIAEMMRIIDSVYAR